MKKAVAAIAAVKAAVQKMKAWSFSRWGDYEQCPLKCKLKHIEHRKEPDNPAMANGTITHSLAAQFVRGDLDEFPPELMPNDVRKAIEEKKKLTAIQKKLLQKTETAYRYLQKMKASVEQEWAFDAEWSPVAWFAQECACRIKVDSYYLEVEKKGKRNLTTVVIIDYKTGKEKGDHSYQRSLYALGGFSMFADAVAVRAEHWYTETGVITLEVFPAKQMPLLRKQWEQRTRAMLNDTRFAPRPGNYCRWCHFRKENGGPCQY